jgi:hypothetical protein
MFFRYLIRERQRPVNPMPSEIVPRQRHWMELPTTQVPLTRHQTMHLTLGITAFSDSRRDGVSLP